MFHLCLVARFKNRYYHSMNYPVVSTGTKQYLFFEFFSKWGIFVGRDHFVLKNIYFCCPKYMLISIFIIHWKIQHCFDFHFTTIVNQLIFFRQQCLFTSYWFLSVCGAFLMERSAKKKNTYSWTPAALRSTYMKCMLTTVDPAILQQRTYIVMAVR